MLNSNSATIPNAEPPTAEKPHRVAPEQSGSAVKTPDAPPAQNDQLPQDAESPPLKGFKMEEETLFKSVENQPVNEEWDWKTLLILLSVFCLGFLRSMEKQGKDS